MPSDPDRSVEELFHRVAAAPPTERPALLDQTCGPNRSLRLELETLLAADDSATSVLDRSAGEVVFRVGPAGCDGRTIVAGQRIGKYEIVRLVGTGGMGNVYEAVQSHPRRTVALKLLRATFASPSEQRRFLYESELLAQLQHSNIAQVFESGLHEDGLVSVPFFAMEYVPDARNVIEHARDRRLSTQQRLDLFLKVCDAVQHGHQKGIVHRDLKPGNILVDAAGEPKIIDYGVARATDGDLRPQTLCTSVHQFIGTLQYMSPEQFKGDGGAVDTRSDVYALGLILYELLADRRPYELGGLTLAEALRAVENEPTLSLATVDRRLRGDLATIVAKAMEKDRARRYQSAGELAEDLRRLLRNEPILARPPSTLYQLGKFTQRHRALVIGAAISMLGLAAGAAAATYWAIEADAQRDQALLAAERSQRVVSFLERLLSTADPKSADYDMTMREAVDRAVGDIDGQFGDDPPTAARVHHAIGAIYARQGRCQEALRHMRSALATIRKMDGGGLDTACVLVDLAWITGEEDPQEPERLFREALDIRRRALGPEHTLVAATAVYWCSALHHLGRYAESEPVLLNALDVLTRGGRGEGEGASLAMRYLATALHMRGDNEEAERLYRRSLAIQEQLLGPDSIELSNGLGKFAHFLSSIGRQEEAEPYLAWQQRIRDRRIGPTVCPEPAASQPN